MTSAAKPAITIDQMIEVVNNVLPPPPKIAVTRSETPFHCSAAGKANLSVTIVSMTDAPDAGSNRERPNSRKKSGVATSVPATMPMTWPMACCRGLAPSM